MKLKLLLILYWPFATLTAEDTGCTQSLPTIAYVKNCPRSKEEWIARAKTKRCDAIFQNCTDSNDFLYHCLLNEWGNATVEVCAPVRYVIGNCAEFNSGGRKIQNGIVACKDCPKGYQSTDAYKFSECYEHVLKVSLNTNEENRSNGKNCENGTSTKCEIAMALVLILFILSFVLSVSLGKFYVKRSSTYEKYAQIKDADDENNTSPGIGERSPLVQGGRQKPNQLHVSLINNIENGKHYKDAHNPGTVTRSNETEHARKNQRI